MTHEELLEKTKEYHQNTDDNVIGVGYGYKTVNGLETDELSIIFTVKEKLPKEQLTEEQLLPQQINIDNEIISTDVIQGEYKLFACDPYTLVPPYGVGFYSWLSTPPTNRNTFRPLIGGISSSNSTTMTGGTGTLGFFAIDNETNSLVGVSNNHVYVDDSFLCSDRSLSGVIHNVNGDIVSQKYEFVGDVHPIGVVKKYYPLQSPPTYNYIDIALTTINESDINYSTSYHQEGLATSSYPFASTSEIDNLLSTDPLLYSSGRRSGAKGEGSTKLVVTQIGLAASIDYSMQHTTVSTYFQDLIQFKATNDNRITYCDYPIAPGDSGSALIADFSGTLKIIGVCFAGDVNSAVACRIDRVASLMNISAWNGGLANFSDTSNILEHTVNGLSSDVYVDYDNGSGVKRYWQVGLTT